MTMATLRHAAMRACPRTLVWTSSPCVQVRGMATEKQIMNQIKATKSIKKITSSMKMVSGAKLKGDENRLAVAKPFASWTYKLSEEPRVTDGATYEEFPQKTLIVPFTTEKGLCGAINSGVARAVRDCAKKIFAQGKECDLVVVGEKGRSQLRRTLGNQMKRSATDIQSPGTFALASSIAEELIAAGATNYDAIMLLYNSYFNVVIYNLKYKLLKPLATEANEGVAPMLGDYEFDADKNEFVKDLYEFMLATHIFHCFMDNAASEQSARMSAMENATKNAGELIGSLTLKYNRARQARITTELIEIISGASALEG